MAKLIESLALSGSQKSDGTPNASGKVWVYVQGSLTLSTVFANADGDAVLSQPVTLDAAGRATIYVDQVVTLHVETAAGANVGDYDLADAPGVVQVQNDAFTGALATGSQGAGGVTDLDTILTSAGTSFGGADFKYKESAGATQRTINAWLKEIHLSVKDFGASGDGVRDDTLAIQATANRCIALGGGVVYFPPGIYIISSAITVNSTTSVSFLGAGYVSAITQTSASANAFTISGSFGFQIAQMSINATSSTGTGISVATSQNFAILDITSSNFQTGIDLSSGSTANITYQVARCFIVTTATAGARAIKSAGASYTSSITDCQLHSAGNSDPDLELIGNVTASAFIAGFVVRGNYIFYGIKLTSVNTSSSPGIIAIHGNNFGNDGTSHKRITVSGTVPAISQVGNNIEGVTFTVATNQNIQPDWTDGRICRINATGSGITVTVLAPTPTPTSRGVQMMLRLYNNNGGVTTWAVGAYLLSATVSTTAGITTELTVEYDLDRAVWMEAQRGTHA